MQQTHASRIFLLLGNAKELAVNLHPSAACGAAGFRRVDLHCHSIASNEADEALLNAIHCPESYSEPAEVHAQARRREMDFVTITDHDSLEGVATLLDRGDVLSGEELTCWFPEDRCKMHVLVWGLTQHDHEALQAAAHDIYEVAQIIEQRRLAHAVAHPVYRQNDLLERWHLERLILLFKGFETLNGAHSALHRDSLEPLLDQLTAERIEELSREHDLRARWPEPWVKARTGGSDDHGLFNIGRTWTEFPAEAKTIEQVLECLRTGRCRPGGEAGSSLKLAHNFFSVGIKYFCRQFLPAGTKPTLATAAMRVLVGEGAAIRKRDRVRLAVRHGAAKVGRALVRPFRGRREPASGTALLAELFGDSCRMRVAQRPHLRAAIARGNAPLGEHTAMFDLVASINRDVAAGTVESVQRALTCGNFGSLFDALSTIAAHQFVMLPYYFALFHQNRERNDLSRITGHGRRRDPHDLRVGVFTDTFDEINSAARFVRAMGIQAQVLGRKLTVHTCTDTPTFTAAYRKNFSPMASRAMPMYGHLKLALPPVLEILEWVDRQQFDAIHVDTPGPMGLCGWMVAKMLRVPLVATYHTDFPESVHTLSGGDYRLSSAAAGYIRWFYGQATAVLARTKHYQKKLADLGIDGPRLRLAHPCVDDEQFNIHHKDVNLWVQKGVREPHRLLFCGRVSEEKNLPFLAQVFRHLCRRRQDTALVVAGDGPHLAALRQDLKGLPVHFLGAPDDESLASIYASSDLFVYPSRIEPVGQVVLEAMASGLPALVSNCGGPQEVVDDQLSGRVLPVSNPRAHVPLWADAIDHLLDDHPLRLRLGRTASARMARYTAAATFSAFWDEHARAALGEREERTAPPETEGAACSLA
jgi:glycosyltransferase involved in cell wall biosynthesis